MKLGGKTAVVTGASQGIGRGIALGLAEAGADVVVNCDRSVDKAEAVAQEVRTQGRRALVIQADVSSSADVQRMLQEALQAFGHIDILVNNAGLFINSPMEDVKEEDWERVMAVNVKGVFLCCQAVGKHMIARQAGGSIINIASIAGVLPEVNGAAYSPSKAAVLALTRLLAIEWAKHGIRVNAINPGAVLTPLQRASYPSERLLQARSSAIPMCRHGTPEEMAKVAVFLASDDSSYITGESIAADGGSLCSMYYLVHKLAEQAPQ